jgi:hypothetical protein
MAESVEELIAALHDPDETTRLRAAILHRPRSRDKPGQPANSSGVKVAQASACKPLRSHGHDRRERRSIGGSSLLATHLFRATFLQWACCFDMLRREPEIDALYNTAIQTIVEAGFEPATFGRQSR